MYEIAQATSFRIVSVPAENESKTGLDTSFTIRIISEISGWRYRLAIMASSGEKLQSASSGMAGYYDSNIIQTKKIRDKFYICGDFEHEAKEGEGLMAPRDAICANHMANLAMKILIEDIKKD